MRRSFIIILTMLSVFGCKAKEYNYHFKAVPLSEALVRLGKEHPEIRINLIYTELETYLVSTEIDTDNPEEAIGQIIGMNPVRMSRKGDTFYIEARQKGKYLFRGQAVGEGEGPLAGATVRLLTPTDSAVVTYGVTDINGRFAIPCDRKKAIVKLTCIGFQPTYKLCDTPEVGAIRMAVRTFQLGAVNVIAETAEYLPDRNLYIPTGRQRESAIDGADLLRRMALPEIVVAPVTDEISDNLGERIPVYINSAEATETDIKALRTTDVRRVEYLEYPMDPRFKGARKVINFIVREYEYGGYTRLRIDETAVNEWENNAAVYSRMAYRRMTYNLAARIGNGSSRHSVGGDTRQDYLLTDPEGVKQNYTRLESTDSSYWKQKYAVNLDFSANYKSETTQANNFVNIYIQDVPRQYYSGNLSVSPTHQGEYLFSENNPQKQLSASYRGDIFHDFGRGYSLNLNPIFQFQRTSDNYLYETSLPENIIRDALERSYYARLNMNFTKVFNPKNSISLCINGSDWISRLRYSGSVNSRNRFYHAFQGGFVIYKFSTQRLNLNIDGGGAWEQNEINGYKSSDFYPFTHLNLQYAFSPKSKFALYFQFASFTASPSELSDAVLPANEFLFITGNPGLKNTRHITIGAQQFWSPVGLFTLAAYGQYFRIFNQQVNLYHPYLDGMHLIRRPENDGDFTNWEIGINGRVNLLGQNLQLSLRPNLHGFHTTGELSRRICSFTTSLSAYYYLGPVHFSTYLATPSKIMSYSRMETSRKWQYNIGCGWHDTHWNVSLTALNFLNHGWKGAERELVTPYFSETGTPLSAFYHPSVQLTATYTIGYGKRINRTDDSPGSAPSGSSAILK